MVASIATSAFFPVPSSSSAASLKNSETTSAGSGSLNVRGIAAKPASSSSARQVKANAQPVPKINGSNVCLKPETLKHDEDAPWSVPITFYKQLTDWSVLLAFITTIFWEAEKQRTLIDWKPRRPDIFADAFGLGKFVQDGHAFRQNFSIRSYEIGADRTASIETLMNHLQETALSHLRVAGLMDDGFGSTPEMSKRNLIWVVAKMHIFVEKYPSWGDVVQIDTWLSPLGKNGIRRDWHIINCQTGDTIVKAASVYVLMNQNTRKLAKMLDEVRAEMGAYFIERTAVIDEDRRKLPKLNHDIAQHVRKSLTPRWGDLDVNQHVNNIKYIGWILESTPISILESHELAAMTLEYRRECRRDSVLESLTSVSTECSNGLQGTTMECVHLLLLENGDEIMRGRTKWRTKRTGLQQHGALPTAST